MVRILHVGLGPLGRRIIRDLHERELGTVVAALDHDQELIGKDLGDVVPEAGRGVPIRGVPGEVFASEPSNAIGCAIVTTSSDLELCADTFRELLREGCAVISTCEELSWPWLRHPVLAAELHELCVRHGARLLGTGVNPGFLMDALPTAVTTACNRVDSVRVERVQDASARRLPFQRKIGVGLDEAAFLDRVSSGSLRHVGLGESLHFLAHHLGWKLDHWEEDLDAVTAEEDFQSALGPVRAGDARGVRQVARGWVGEHCVLELVFHAAAEEPESYDHVLVEGDPPLDLTFKGGVHGDTATSAIVLNSIRSLLAAEPGLHTMGSLPLRGCGAPS